MNNPFKKKPMEKPETVTYEYRESEKEKLVHLSVKDESSWFNSINVRTIEDRNRIVEILMREKTTEFLTKK